MTVILTAQFSAFSNFMHPGKRPVRELVALPLIYGVMIGCAFGTFNVFSKPQILHKPAMERYYESMGRVPKKKVKDEVPPEEPSKKN